ncbi:MAG: hypothetical protein ACERKZ_15905 [Lachnotalea sp.]
MEKKMEHTLDVRDQLIAGLKRENELQSKIINEQKNSSFEYITSLEYRL